MPEPTSPTRQQKITLGENAIVGNFGENYDAQSQNSRALQIRERDDGT
jgi:hypothetical protein